MNNAEQFVSRLPAGAPDHLAGDIRLAFKTIDTAREVIAEVRKDAHLNRTGQNVKIAQRLADGVFAHLAQLRKGVEKGLSDATGRRVKLRESVTKADAFSQALKAETRAWFRGLPLARKVEMIKSGDPLIVEAIATAPAYLSELTTELWENVIETAIEARFGDAMAQVDLLERAYAEADAAMQVVENAIAREADVAPAKAA
jgi:hypothetical protein